MRFRLLAIIFLSSAIVLSACAGKGGQGNIGGTETDVPANVIDEGPQGTISQEPTVKPNLPSIFPPRLSITDTREDETGGWVVDIPGVTAGNTYQVSSDNDVWVEFSFSEVMDEADVLAHLKVEPVVKMNTEWFKTPTEHRFRVQLLPVTTSSSVKVGLTAGAKAANGSRILAEDIMVTLERYPAPRATMYLKKYPFLKMLPLSTYWASAEEAEIFMDFNKPMDKDSVARALAQVAPAEEWELNWLNEEKLIIRFNPPAENSRTYDLSLRDVKDKDGVLLSLPEQIELRVVPPVTVKSLNLLTGQQAKVIAVSGGFEGGVVSPDGSRAVFWEMSSSVGDAITYRYWLQELVGDKKVLLTEGGETRVQWYPGGDRVQIGKSTFSSEGKELKKLPEEVSLVGLDIGPLGQMSYLSIRWPQNDKPKVDLVYQYKGTQKVIEDFSYPLIIKNGFLAAMNPSYDPSGRKLAVIENPSGDGTLKSGRACVIDLETGEKSVLADQAVNVFWSPQGNYLAVGKADRVEILNPAGEPKLSLSNHDYHSIVGWSPDGQYLLLRRTEHSKWVTELLEISNGQGKEIPGIPLGFDTQGRLYYIDKLTYPQF